MALSITTKPFRLITRLSPQDCISRLQAASGTWSDPAGKPVRAGVWKDQVHLTSTRLGAPRAPLRLRVLPQDGGGAVIEGRLGQNTAPLLAVGVVFLLGFGAAITFSGGRPLGLFAAMLVLGVVFAGFLASSARIIRVHEDILAFVRTVAEAADAPDQVVR